MKLLLLLILIAGLAFVVPRLKERTETTCGALEARVAELMHAELDGLPASNNPRVAAAIAALHQWAPTPGTVEVFVQDRLPFLPVEFGCAAGYWMTYVKPDLRELAPGILPLRPVAP